MKPSKEAFKKQIAALCAGKEKFTILDLGSGTSNNFIELLKNYPQIEYTGVEPYTTAYEKAKVDTEQFGKRVTLYNQNAYDVQELKGKEFDLVCSLSTLEHVKYLDTFLKFSAGKVKKGGLVIHLWDNAHQLTPSSLKERFQCWLSNHLKFLVPSLKFVRAVFVPEVRASLEAAGLVFVEAKYFHTKSNMKFLGAIKSKMTHEDLDMMLAYEKYVQEGYVGAGKEKLLSRDFLTIAVTMKR